MALTISCEHCPGALYAPYLTHFILRYSNVNRKMITTYQGVNVSTAKCMGCSTGSTCSSGQMKPLPGYWGIQVGEEIEFIQCPEGYCCTGTECSFKRPCGKHRMGTLCAACQHQYSLSIFSNDCVLTSKCTDSWVWAAAFLGAIFYMLWYSFKDDSVHVIVSWSSYVFHKVFPNLIRKFKNPENDSVANGYFGILVYFTQIIALIKVDDGSVNDLGRLISSYTFYFNIFINIDPAEISMPACPIENLTFGMKIILKLCFFISIYFSWCLVFVIVRKIRSNMKIKRSLSALKLKLLAGIIEIIKYTYEGFASISFISLLCVRIAGESVWKYDAEIKCFSSLQWIFIAFCIFYVFPFVLSFAFATKHLKEGRIPAPIFIIACVLPFPFVFIFLWTFIKELHSSTGWTFSHKGSKSVIHTEDRSPSKILFMLQPRYELTVETKLMLECLEGPYNTMGQAVYWESVLSGRRLILTLSIFIDNFVWKFTFIQIFCTCVLVHHIIVKPFQNINSNRAETLSLLLILVIANFNALKGYFVDSGLRPSGTSAHAYSFLNLTEDLALYILLLVMILGEYTQTQVKQLKQKLRKLKKFGISTIHVSSGKVEP